MLSGGYHGLIAMVAATHSGMTTDEFEAEVRQWVVTTRHPTTNKLFTEMVFQPMLEHADQAPGDRIVNDNVEKPAAIQKFIGRRPIAAFGNSDGDLEMLQWTVAGAGARLALLVHHNDAIREFAYDRAPSIGQLDKALDEANAKGWTVVDMRNDWRRIFPVE
jgi:hypothetical protein